MVAHRLAPEHPFPAAPLDFAARYLGLLEQGHRPENIFLAADTAGASIVLGALQLLIEDGADLPAGIVLETLPGKGHMLLEEATEQVVRAIRRAVRR